MLYSFRGTVVFDLLQVHGLASLRLLTISAVSGMDSNSQSDLESNQMMVGFSHNVCATIAPSCHAGHHCTSKGLNLDLCLPFSSGSMLTTF